MPKQPLAEVFGFPVDNDSPEAERYRQTRLCPYNTELVPMKNTHHAEMMELLIGRNLDWARSKSE